MTPRGDMIQDSLSTRARWFYYCIAFDIKIEEPQRHNGQPTIYILMDSVVQEEFQYGFEIQRYREQLP
jgi:hypothetical protein